MNEAWGRHLFVGKPALKFLVVSRIASGTNVEGHKAARFPRRTRKDPIGVRRIVIPRPDAIVRHSFPLLPPSNGRMWHRAVKITTPDQGPRFQTETVRTGLPSRFAMPDALAYRVLTGSETQTALAQAGMVA